MSAATRPAGDEVIVSVLVEVEPEAAFRVFTQEIDAWWQHGPKYRIARGRSVVELEPRLGGRLFESFDDDAGPKLAVSGVVTVWEPPSRLVFEWSALNFAPGEKTEVEVRFDPAPSGTMVTVKHRGWTRIRPDHPVRHGLAEPAFIRMMGLWWSDLMTSLRRHVAAAQRRS